MSVAQAQSNPVQLQVAPATLAATSVSLIWQRPKGLPQAQYRVTDEAGHELARRTVHQTHVTLTGLTPRSPYTFMVAVINGGSVVGTPATVTVTTRAAGPVIDVTQAPYLADATGRHMSTAKVQAAIDACPAGGTVLIPAGATVQTGALFLKSHLTFRIEGTLQASVNAADYRARAVYPGQVNADGLILNRYEGWEMFTYASVLNAGWLNTSDRLAAECTDLTICGHGTIDGGGMALGNAMRQLYADKKKFPEYVSDNQGGRRNRGRLIQLLQCHDVDIHDLTLQNPPAWTVHMVYCDTVTTHDVTILSHGIDNGDGWDPDSSRHMMIYGTTFDIGDDCITVKSGKNPEGNHLNLPTEHVRVFDVHMRGGHGMIVGSEMSGGVSDVVIRDSRIEHTTYGLELKANPDRGGYIRDVTMQDCRVDRFAAHSVPYNADGAPAPDLPVVEDITVADAVITGAEKQPVDLIGFTRDDRVSPIRRVRMTNVTLGVAMGGVKEIRMQHCTDVTLTNVRQASNGQLPAIKQTDVKQLTVQ
ncbi:glycosyl hydrolase family 28 protein [Schleiferilactobacillus harbinensis]|uniref:glycosyl hydrolase family 28 protein n=1 Tax=Schleiferilactobacillus harbinensis TaxID=304207 RepID=UPI00168BFA2A|nr:glycoside hydrolase family 28 protein [Schleiferilactobacillus harbinensis]